MILLIVLSVLALIFGIGAVFAFAAKVFIVTIVGGVLAIVTLVALIRHAFEDQRV